MIEPAWGYLKRVTTKERPKTHGETVKAWTTAWQDLEQSRIQNWIKCIKLYIDKIIEEGRNYYCEGQDYKSQTGLTGV